MDLKTRHKGNHASLSRSLLWFFYTWVESLVFPLMIGNSPSKAPTFPILLESRVLGEWIIDYTCSIGRWGRAWGSELRGYVGFLPWETTVSPGHLKNSSYCLVPQHLSQIIYFCLREVISHKHREDSYQHVHFVKSHQCTLSMTSHICQPIILLGIRWSKLWMTVWEMRIGLFGNTGTSDWSWDSQWAKHERVASSQTH